jgi:hypothetical protein
MFASSSSSFRDLLLLSPNFASGRRRGGGGRKTSRKCDDNLDNVASSLLSNSKTHRRQRRRLRGEEVVRATAREGEREGDGLPAVQGMSRDPCDSFECKGTSPAVEGSLRQIARDMRDGKDANRSVVPYAKDVRFSDGARAFRGSEKFKKSNCELNAIFGGGGGGGGEKSDGNNEEKKFTSAVDSITVQPGGSAAKILWRIESKDRNAKVNVETTLEMNLITGKVLSQDDQWKFVKGGEIIESKRKALAVPDKVGNAVDEIMRTVDDATRAVSELVNSKEGGEDDYAVDPNDPMKFFSYENNQNRNLSEFALLLALLFLISKLYEQVSLLK